MAMDASSKARMRAGGNMPSIHEPAASTLISLTVTQRRTDGASASTTTSTHRQ